MEVTITAEGIFSVVTHCVTHWVCIVPMANAAHVHSSKSAQNSRKSILILSSKSC